MYTDSSMRLLDFLLFIPTNAPGLKAVFSYYQSTAKLTAEGDVHMSDEALQGLGTILSFLKTSLFGAITQLVKPTHSPDEASQPPPILRSGRGETPPVFGHPYRQHEHEQIEDSPYMPTKSARQKDLDQQFAKVAIQQQEQQRMKLTNLVPDVGYFLAGGLSGITSRTATAPLDRLKVYLIAQTGNAKEAVQAAKSGRALAAFSHGANTLWTATKELWAAGGIRSLFAGECRVFYHWFENSKFQLLI